jgi:hypothetical protein
MNENHNNNPVLVVGFEEKVNAVDEECGSG